MLGLFCNGNLIFFEYELHYEWVGCLQEQIESDAMRQLSVSFVLSPEQIVQCTKADYGCDGGETEDAFDYVKSAGGLALESAYPYTSYWGDTGTCSTSSLVKKVTVESYKTLSDEASMAAYVQSTGPLSVCLDASSWSSYASGILSVCGTSVDHCVQAVGVLPTSTGGYWKVRNSWGTDWVIKKFYTNFSPPVFLNTSFFFFNRS
jgi:hypothetical protein